MEVQLFSLVPNVTLPMAAPATTRSHIPSGYGVQEQCLPFTAATALGFLIGSPIAFGLCLLMEVPAGAHAFRSPLDYPRADGTYEEPRVFYVKDDPRCSFVKNAFMLNTAELGDALEKSGYSRLQPGLSFFDRPDQLDLFKLHLPYIWRTPAEVDALFLPAINRSVLGLTVLSGVVETDWYGSPVNLVLRKPPAAQSIHVSVGDLIAQVVFMSRSQRRPTLKVVASHARAARDFRSALGKWTQHHAEDRSVYKKLARSHHGRVAAEHSASSVSSDPAEGKNGIRH